MRRSPVGLTLLLLVLAVAIVPVVVAQLHRTQISRDNFKVITEGMTLQEVEDILGGPERDETNGDFPTFDLLRHTGDDWVVVLDDSVKQWNSSQGWICVSFNERGQVYRKKFVDGHWLRPTWFDHAQEFFGL